MYYGTCANCKWEVLELTGTLGCIYVIQITGLQLTSQQSGKFFEEKFYCLDPQHGHLVMWLQTTVRIHSLVIVKFTKKGPLNEFESGNACTCIYRPVNSPR